MEIKTRYICAGICSGLSALFSFGAFAQIFRNKLPFFAILYTFSIVLALVGSLFMAGLKKHLQRIRECVPHTIAGIVVVAGIAVVLLAVFAIGGTFGTVLAVFMLICQLAALGLFYLTMNDVLWAGVKRVLSCVTGGRLGAG
jgi:hypothetical protein